MNSPAEKAHAYANDLKMCFFCGILELGSFYLQALVTHAFILAGTVVIPDSVVEVDASAFADCDALETVVLGKKVETVGRHAFSCDEKLKTIYVPKTLKGMGDNAFYCCDELSDIYYEGSEADIAGVTIDVSNLEYIEKAAVYYNHQY